ncbi:Uu.00g052770.m01.CDS01 [Anthostomella pinea]|uniref:Uu.00g052770.m01.CDS01 n=1 Tax=Anthostomella pinea TaxID=933095 RepID=A0AAI8VW92_9PEZI|nr:Uu.00g052770.m01.CDS01 [Anthostomella pinea]
MSKIDDSTLCELLDLKSAAILFILDRRLVKANQSGIQRIANKIFLNAKTSALENGVVNEEFQCAWEK